MKDIIALVGNPNTGKTTFFNSVTNADEHVGNWHGVTVEFKEKKYKTKSKKEVTVTDLPGTYSLSPYSFEEGVTRDYLLSHKNCKVINIADGNNLGKSLLLTFELLEMGICPILCINMATEIKKKGVEIDIKKLKNLLGIEVFLCDAYNKKQVLEIVEKTIDNNTKYQNKLTYQKDIFFRFKDILNFDIETFDKIKVLELDEYYIKKHNLSQKQIEILTKNNTCEYVLKTKYEFIDKILSQCVQYKNNKEIYGYGKLDKVVLNRWLAIPIFVGIIFAIFFFTFGPVGTFLTNTLSLFFENIIFAPLIDFTKKLTTNKFIIDFVSFAVCGSMQSIVCFLPQIVLMFFGLYILEDTGYMSRLAFSFEDYLKKVGLSGKSVFTLLMCFGCSTTATLTARNLENKNSKIKTAMLTPYISCSAKLPIYSVICGAFFPKHKFLIIIGLYLLGIVIALLTSYLLNKKVLKSENVTFAMEMPPYRFPSAKKVFKNVFVNIKQFLLRAGTMLFSFSCIIWILQNCNIKMQYGTGDSILQVLAGFVAPLFAPLGFGNAGVVTALLCGIVAKEIIVSTIGMVNGLGEKSGASQIANSILLPTSVFFLTKQSSLAFLVFATLYVPCISTTSVMIKEIGFKWTAISSVIQFAVSYFISFVVYKISTYFVCNGFVSGIVSVVVFIVISLVVIFAVGLLKPKNACKFCQNRKYCNNK